MTAILLLACTKTVDSTTDTLGPPQRYSHVGTLDAAGDNLYIAGGSSEQGRRLDAWRFELESRTWTQLNDPPESLFRSTLVRPRDDAWVFAGTSSDGTESDRLWRWDLDDDTWTEHGGEPPGRYKAAAVATGESTWILHGGRTNDAGSDETLADVWAHDSDEDAWSRVPTAETHDERTRQALAFDGAQTVYLQGGIDGTDTRHDRVAALDLGDDWVWRDIEVEGETPGNRASHSMVVHDGRLIVWGGQGTDDTVWAFDIGTSTWSAISEGGPAGRDAQVTDLVGDTMIIMGGDPADDDNLPHFVNDVWAFDLVEHTWEELWAIE